MQMNRRLQRLRERGIQILAVLFLASGLLSVFAVISCSGAGAGSRNYEEDRSCADILDIADPRERQLALLRRHLEMPGEVCPSVYLARENIEAGRFEEARLYLDAVADDLNKKPENACRSCVRLGGYLSAYVDFMDGKYNAALEHLGVIESSGGVQEGTCGSPDTGGALNGREKLLKARICTAMDKHGDTAAGLLLDLWQEDREILGGAGVLMLAHSLMEEGMEDKAGEILMVWLSGAPYSGASAGLWAELCRRAGLPEFLELTLAEFLIIEGLKTETGPAAGISGGRPAPESLSPESAGIKTSPAETGSIYARNIRAEEIVTMLRSGNWCSLLSALKDLEEGQSHRFARYLTVLCRLNDGEAGPEDLAEYQDAGAPYRGTQIYYSFLWKAAKGMGRRYRTLCEEALTASIQAGPHSQQALEARRQLAVFYGVPDNAALLPLTAGEMEELAGFVVEGAPADILLPLAGFLEWPENRCSLHAALILRQLREVPGVRKLLREQVKQSNQRGRERIEAILSM